MEQPQPSPTTATATATADVEIETITGQPSTASGVSSSESLDDNVNAVFQNEIDKDDAQIHLLVKAVGLRGLAVAIATD
jgi:hypothetical protein